jgi:DNA-binding MarR family transcriptional regulator
MSYAASLLRSRPESAPAAELVNSVHDVMKLVVQHAMKNLLAEGITMGQFWTLHLVSSLPAASVSDLSRRLAVSAPTVCSNLDQLEEAGLVVRHRSEKDRRTVEISLTPKGKKVEVRAWAHIARLMTEASSKVPADDIATATGVFRSIRAQLETWPAPPEVVE